MFPLWYIYHNSTAVLNKLAMAASASTGALVKH